MHIIRVKDFALVPGLRYSSLSDKSGEDFYHEELNPAFARAFEQSEPFLVDLDGTRGLLPSFLDEAFGNLVYDFTLKWVENLIVVNSTVEPHWLDYISKKCEEWERRRVAKEPRKITKKHQPWYALESNNLVKKEWTLPS